MQKERSALEVCPHFCFASREAHYSAQPSLERNALLKGWQTVIYCCKYLLSRTGTEEECSGVAVVS